MFYRSQLSAQHTSPVLYSAAVAVCFVTVPSFTEQHTSGAGVQVNDECACAICGKHTPACTSAVLCGSERRGLVSDGGAPPLDPKDTPHGHVVTVGSALPLKLSLSRTVFSHLAAFMFSISHGVTAVVSVNINTAPCVSGKRIHAVCVQCVSFGLLVTDTSGIQTFSKSRPWLILQTVRFLICYDLLDISTIFIKF